MKALAKAASARRSRDSFLPGAPRSRDSTLATAPSPAWHIALAIAFALSLPSPAHADDAPAEVQVLAPHRDVGETTLRREDTREIPGTFGDPSRIAEALPGVVPTTSGLQAFFVRGAPPTSTGTFIDGVAVPVLYHIGFGPSVVHPALLDHVDFYQGAPPAEYGRYVGGVLAATTAAPADHAHGEANVRSFDAGALVETPFADGKGTVLAAARYGYPALVLPLFTSDVGLSYWDYQARATWDVARGDRLGAFVFGSYDRLTEQITPEQGQSYTQQAVADEFHRADLRYDHALGQGASVRVAFTLGHDVVGNDAASAVDDAGRVRAELDARPSSSVRLRAGADAQLDALHQGPTPEGATGPATPLVPRRDSVVFGAHGDVVWRVTREVELTPGLRAEVLDARTLPGSPGAGTTATPLAEPRLAARVKLARGVTSVSTFGVSHQLLGIPAQYPTTSPYLQPTPQEGLMTSEQMSQGVELALPWSFSLATTAFLHDYSGLPDVTWQCPGPPESGCVTPTVNGRAYGLEVLLRRSFSERFTLWISYTLSRSTRQARPFDAPAASAPTMTILSEYDRTHVVSAVASYDFGHDWSAGLRVFAYSGRPYTPVAGTEWVEPYDSARLPGFYRIDARLEKSWRLGERDRIALVVEGINVTLNKEAIDADCGVPSSGGVGSVGAGGVAGPGGTAAPGAALNRCTFDTIGPITIPSVGVEGTFR